MSNLQFFDNIFANLSESAYTNRPLNFPTKENSNNIESFNFSAVGSVVGRIAGVALGSWLGSLANKELDKGIKPKKKGWGWPW